MKTLKYWLGGIRLYIALAAIVLTPEIWWWARAAYGNTNLAVIRTQEVYAWLALGLLAAAMLIGPLLKLMTRLPKPVVLMLRDSRRMLGITSAGFAILHVSINYIGLFGLPNPLTLSDSYQKSFVLGALASIILILMAVTSFDAAFKGMGVWWFRLHRLVYVAALLTLMHAFMIGSHATSVVVLSILTALAVLIVGVHGFVVLGRARPGNVQIITLTLSIVFMVAILNYGLSQHLGHNVLLHLHDPEHLHG